MALQELRGLRRADIWDFENGFYWFSDPRRLCKAMAHFELYKMILGIPGDVVEFGVHKGASLIRWACYRDALEAPAARQIVAFDTFGKFPSEHITSEVDKEFIKSYEDEAGVGLSEEEIITLLSDKNYSQNVSIVPENVLETLQPRLFANPAKRVSLIHLDMDVFEPTELALQHMWERLVKGGVVVIDDYNAVEGATRAADNFCRRKDITLRKLSLSRVPSYIVKP